VGATGLKPSEREERHQGDYSSNGADDDGVHYQLVHGSFPSWTKEQRSGITAGWARRAIFQSSDRASARTDAQILQRLRSHCPTGQSRVADDRALIELYAVFTFGKSLTTVSLHDVEGDAAAQWVSHGFNKECSIVPRLR
jgi:hypothetical protein